MHDAHSLAASSESTPLCPPRVAGCGFYVTIRSGALVLHMSASHEHMRQMRAYVFEAVTSTGADEQVADVARLVANELVGNAVRVGGPWTPVIVQIVSTSDQIRVRVHDPAPCAPSERRGRVPDDDRHGFGLGLRILDTLAPGWTVQATLVGKLATATLACGESTTA
ncbi:ATP-binding protein [Streptomyces geranii]|uniref:ATP-binding protein n=1 Tax=Streptomyces geranii TaxID=2058923 RepID=UPI000D0343C4|nr:ATP-binding protein [Streptomyces geranii]